jgi:hypothetical protein
MSTAARIGAVIPFKNARGKVCMEGGFAMQDEGLAARNALG